MPAESQPGPLLRRVAETGRARLRFEIDGKAAEAMDGDTLLTALLINGSRIRQSEFGDGPRAGFCLMGACQDCWVWTTEGARLRACGTQVAEGMRIVTRGVPWPIPA
jgi:NADH dehydrogenase/NADH:ubiquinone oxidoreductase subunit G